MDISQAIRSGFKKEIPNPNYTGRNKKTQSPTILVDDFGSNNMDAISTMFRENDIHPTSISQEDVDKFNYLNLQPVPNVTNLDKQLADVQTTSNKWWNAIKQTFWNEMALGTVKAFSDIFDYTTASKFGYAEDNDYSNSFSTYLSNLQEEYRKKNPIFVDPDKNIGNGGLMDAGWLASNFPSIASTVTLMVPGMAISKGAKLIAAATKLNQTVGYTRRALTGLRNFEKLNEAQQLAKLGEMGKMTKWINTVGKDSANWLIENGINASVMRIAENYQESSQTYNQMYEQSSAYFNSMTDEQWQDYVDKHKSLQQDIDFSSRDAVARGIAKKAADKTFQMDVINFFSDLLQLKALGDVGKLAKNTILTRGARKADRLARQTVSRELGVTISTKNGFGTGIKNFISDYSPALYEGLGEISEGIEEAVNYIAQEEGLHYGNVALGIEEDSSTFGNRLKSYLNSPQLYDAAFWGVLGGIAFQVVGGKIQQIGNVANKAISDITNKNKTGNEKSTTWSETWELPTTKRQVSEINSRIQLAQDVSSKLAQIKENINPFTHEVIADNSKREIIKEELRRKIIDDFITRTTINSIDAGTYDNLVDFYSDDVIDKKLQELGLLSASNETNTKQDILRKMNEVADSYQRNFILVNSLSSAMNNGGVPMEYQQIIAKDNTIAQREIEFIDNQIQKYEREANTYTNIYKENLKQYGIEATDLTNGTIIASMVASDRIGRLKARKKAIIDSGIRSAENDDILRTIDREIEAANKLLTLNQEDKVATAARTIWAHANASRYISDTTGKNISTANSSALNEHLAKIAAKPTNQTIKELTGIDFELTDNELVRLFDNNNTGEFGVVNDKLRTINKEVNTFTGNTTTAIEQAAPELFKTYLNIAGLQMNKLESQRLLALTTPNISRRIQDLDNNLNAARKTALNKAFNVLDKLADKYGSDKVINYLWTNTPIEGITDSEKVYLDDAAVIVDLQNEGNINLLQTLANRFLMKAAIREDNENIERANSSTNQNSNSATQNQQPIVSSQQGSQTATMQSKEQNQGNKSSQIQLTNEQTTQPINSPVGNSTTSGSGSTPNSNFDDEYYSVNVDLNTNQPVITRANENDGSFTIIANSTNSSENVATLVPKNGNYINIAKLSQLTIKSLYDIEDDTIFDDRENNFTNNWEVTNPIVTFDGDEYKVIQKGTIKRKNTNSTSFTGEQTNNNQNTQSVQDNSSKTPIIQQEENKSQNQQDDVEILDAKAVAELEESSRFLKNLMSEFAGFIKDSQDKNLSPVEIYSEFLKKLNTIYSNPSNTQKSAIANFKKIVELRLKPKDELEQSLYNAIKNSSITDIIKDKDTRKQLYDDFIKSVESLISNYANRYNLPKINGKIYISIESLLRDLNQNYGESVAYLLYQNIINYVNNEGVNKYILLDKTDNTSELITNVYKSKERRLSEKIGQNSVYRLNIDRFQENSKEYKQALDNLSRGSKLEMNVNENTHEILFSTNGVVIGSMTVPKTDKGVYNLTVKGWNVFLDKDGDYVKSEVKDMILDLLTSRFNRQYKDNERTSLFDKIIEYTFDNSISEERKKELISLIDKSLKRKYNKLIDKSSFNNKEDRINFIANIFRYLDYNSSNKEDYKKYISNSINKLFNKLYDSYDTAFNVAQEINSGNVEAAVANITLGELLRVATINEKGIADFNSLTPCVGTANSNGSYGNNNALDTESFNMYGGGSRKVAVAATNKQGKTILTALGDEIEVPSFNRGNVVVVFTLDKEKVYVPALSSFLFNPNRPLVGEAKNVANSIKQVIDELVEDYSNNDSNAAINLLIFLNSLCGKTNNEVPINLKKILINNSTLCFGTQWTFNKDNVIIGNDKNNITIYFAGDNVGKILVNNTNFSNINDLKNVINNILTNLRFNVSYSCLKNNASPANTNLLSIGDEQDVNGLYHTTISIVKPNGIGKGKVIYSKTYNSFNEYALNSGIIRVDTKKENGSNFVSKGKNQRTNRTITVEFKRKSSPVKDDNQQIVITPEDETINTINKNGIQGLVKDVVGEEKLNILNNNDLLPKNVIFDENLNGTENITDETTNEIFAIYTGRNAEVNVETGVVTVGRRWISMYSETGEFAGYKGEARKEALRKLIHEQLHNKIQESGNRKELLQRIKDIFEEFKTSLDNITDENKKNILKQYLYEENSPILQYENKEHTENDILEEFLVESFTSKTLADYLNSVKSETTDAKTKETLWSKIFKVLNDIFGWNIEKGSLREKELIALSDIIDEISVDTKGEQEGSIQGTQETKMESQTSTEKDDLDDFFSDDDGSVTRGSVITEITIKQPIMSIKTIVNNLPLEDQAKFLKRVNEAEYEISCKI